MDKRHSEDITRLAIPRVEGLHRISPTIQVIPRLVAIFKDISPEALCTSPQK
jgi:hypothetical protein